MLANYQTKNLRPSLRDRAAAEIELRRRKKDKTSVPIWQPNPDHEDGRPNPQRLAQESDADILGFGGAAGGGKTDLLLGLARTEQKHAVIFRRTFKNLRGIIERSRALYNADGLFHAEDRYNESLHRWAFNDGGLIEFESCQYESNKEDQRGRPRDFYGFDEVTELSKTTFQFIIGWLRSTEPGQRCRVVLTFNPPVDESGSWITEYFLPWVAYLHPEEFSHPNPAKPGELRWYATIDGKETEVQNGDPIDRNDEIIKPLSRTFIPSRLADNPHLVGTNYGAIIDSMPEPLRSQLKFGDFVISRQANPWQVIPTAWVKLAQKRWMETEKPRGPLSGVGVDLVRGGADSFALSKRFGAWFDEIVTVPGVDIEDGPTAAGLMFHSLEKEKHIGYINMDVIGVGSSAYDSAKVMWPNVNGVNVANRSGYIAMSKTAPPQKLFTMRNVRAEMHWRLREALDPETGQGLALPPGNDMVADLCAAQYKVLAGGVIQIERKDDIKKRLGRSPDIGEAVMLAFLEIKTLPPTGLIINDIPLRSFIPKRERLTR